MARRLYHLPWIIRTAACDTLRSAMPVCHRIGRIPSNPGSVMRICRRPCAGSFRPDGSEMAQPGSARVACEAGRELHDQGVHAPRQPRKRHT